MIVTVLRSLTFSKIVIYVSCNCPVNASLTFMWYVGTYSLIKTLTVAER